MTIYGIKIFLKLKSPTNSIRDKLFPLGAFEKSLILWQAVTICRLEAFGQPQNSINNIDKIHSFQSAACYTNSITSVETTSKDFASLAHFR